MRLAFWRRPKPLDNYGPALHVGPVEVMMLRTVWSREGEWLANRIYYLSEEKADEFIHQGYASGELSRVWTADEIAALVNRNQEVRIGG